MLQSKRRECRLHSRCTRTQLSVRSTILPIPSQRQKLLRRPSPSCPRNRRPMLQSKRHTCQLPSRYTRMRPSGPSTTLLTTSNQRLLRRPSPPRPRNRRPMLQSKRRECRLHSRCTRTQLSVRSITPFIISRQRRTRLPQRPSQRPPLNQRGTHGVLVRRGSGSIPPIEQASLRPSVPQHPPHLYLPVHYSQTSV